ncbi:serine/threonine protein kinase, partial [Streptomyces sp. NPDC059456]
EPETIDAPVLAPGRQASPTAGAAPLEAATTDASVASPAAAPVHAAPRRRRRVRAAVVAGAAAAALLAAAFGYTFLDRDGSADRNTEQVPVGASAPEPAAVRVSVTGANTSYTGPCSPPADRAPTFTATFTAAEPVRISYRWVSDDGSVVDPQWRVMTLRGSGTGTEGRATGRDTVQVTTYAKAGTLNSTIGVEIRDPVRTVSRLIPFSVTCRN